MSNWSDFFDPLTKYHIIKTGKLPGEDKQDSLEDYKKSYGKEAITKKKWERKEKAMKNEIKALYKKDPKLAKEVAKVLGYTIKIKAGSNSIKSLKRNSNKLLKILTDLAGLRKSIEIDISKSGLKRTSLDTQFSAVSEYLDKAIYTCRNVDRAVENLDAAS